MGFMEYMFDVTNMMTIIFIVTGCLNTYLHFQYSPYTLSSKLIMILNLIMSLSRTLELMRIMAVFSPIVTMMSGVLGEFSDFMLFFFILVVFLSMGFSVCQIDDPTISA